MKKLTKALIGTAAAAGAVSFGAGYIIFNEVMNRDALIYPKIADSAYKKMDHVDVAEEDERLTWYKNQEPQYFEMINPRNFRLKAKYIPADKPSKKYVFCSHGYRSTGNGEFKLMAKFYHDMGINLFIVDHQAAGESDGKYIRLSRIQRLHTLAQMDARKIRRRYRDYPAWRFNGMRHGAHDVRRPRFTVKCQIRCCRLRIHLGL